MADLTQDLHPICKNFLAAGQQAGFPYNPDFNGASQEGVGLYQITAKNGQRMSAARAYLWPAKGRKNLRIVKKALVQRILFDGKRATGVAYRRNGKLLKLNARREVILSAGAVNSPQLLMLSGIGAAEELKQQGIAPVLDLPAVGRNLQDHLGVDYLYRAKVPTLNNQLYPWWGKAMAGDALCTDPARSPVLKRQSGRRLCEDRPQPVPAQYAALFLTGQLYQSAAGKRPLMNPDSFPGFLLGIQPTKPTSRGKITLASADPSDAPKIQPNYLTTDHDVAEMMAGVKLIREMASAPALQEIIES